MKNIKTIIGLAVSATLAILLIGCKTVGGQSTPDVDRIARVTKEAATIGTQELLKRHPEWRAQFRIARGELVALEASDTVSLDSVLEIINRLPIKELKSDDARLAVQGARLMISAIDVPEVSADRLTQIRPIVKALREGIEAGGVGP